MQKSEDKVANSVDNQELITLTADIAASFVSNNRIGTGDIAELIASVHSALSAAKLPAVRTEGHVKDQGTMSKFIGLSGIKMHHSSHSIYA